MMIKKKFRNLFNKVVLGFTGCLAVVGLACSFTIKDKAVTADALSDIGKLDNTFYGWIDVVNPALYSYETNLRSWGDSDSLLFYTTTYNDSNNDQYWDMGYIYVPWTFHINGIDYSRGYPYAVPDVIYWLRFDIRVFNSGGNSSITNFLNNIGVVPFAWGAHLYGTSSSPTFILGGNMKPPSIDVLRGNNINLPNVSDWAVSSWASPMSWLSALCSTDSSGPYYFGFNINKAHEYLAPLVGCYANALYANENVESAYNNGYETGKRSAETQAYSKGYQDGVESVSSAGAVMMSLFGSVVSVPINVMNGMSQFMIWGIPIISIIISFLFIGLLIWVVKRFIS